ncbi:hypothetical protein D3C71_1988120 [compost metagenome]
MVRAEVFDQLQEYLRFVFLADRSIMAIVRFRLAGIGLIVEHHIEAWLQGTHRLDEECGGCQ